MTSEPNDPSGPNEARPVIALVEDSKTIRFFVRMLLDDRFEIVEYETGPEALAGMIASVPDLVLLDISLPEMDGTVVFQHAREDEALGKVPVIALTASDNPDDRDRYLAMGFDAFVSKPIVDETVLFGEIDRLLGRPGM